MLRQAKGYRVDFWSMVALISFLTFGLFLVYPFLNLIISGFRDTETGALTLANFIRFFSRKYYYKSLINSFIVTICVTTLVVLIGVPLAYITSTIKIKFLRVADILIIISLLSPPFIGAYSWIMLFGRAGVITKFLSSVLHIQFPSIYGFNGIMMVFVLKLFPYIYMYTKGALKKMDASLGEAAESLGYHGLRKITTIMLPLILPTILAGGIIVFMRALADFGTPQLIGEGYMVLPVIIYNEFIGESGGSANFAAAISVIMMLIAGGVFLIQNYFASRRNYVMSSLNPINPQKITGIKNVLAHAYVYILVFIATLPQITVVYTSFLKTSGVIFVKGFTLDSYINVYNKMGKSIFNTFKFGLIAIAIIIIFGMLISYITVRRKSVISKILDLFIMFPYVIPGSVLGITLLLSFNSKPLMLSGTILILIVAYVIRRLPYTVRSSAAILRQINTNIEEASISLGYPPMQTFFKVTMPAMLPGIFSGAILSWITVINELSSTLILYTGSTATMSVAIYQEVMRASYGTAAALSTILTVTTIISLMCFFKLSGSEDISL
ncbi:iron ABC transporter permease [Oscillospiraceae bacterium PP1C4]